MNRIKNIHRGDIFCADLSPVVGSEQAGIRPVLILQNNVGNQFSPTVIVAAITSRPKKHLPTHVTLAESLAGLPKSSVALLEQLRTIDRRRLREYMGSVDEHTIQKIDTALQISVGLAPAFL